MQNLPILKTLSSFSPVRICLAIGLVSFIFSIALSFESGLPNTDGILYLRGAKAFIESGFYAAADYFPSPAYSILIGSLSFVTNIELTTAAHLLNALFCGVIGYAIVDITRLLTGRMEPAFCAALLFLLHPSFNEYRTFIVRDFAFWAAILLFVDCQIRFNLYMQKHMLFISLFLLLLGGLFRTECFIFLAVPLINLFFLRKHPSLFKLLASVLAGFAGLGTLIIVTAGLLLTTQQIQLVEKILLLQIQYVLAIGTTFQMLVSHFNESILIGYLDEYTPAVLLTSFLALLLFKFINTITWPYLLAFALFRQNISLVKFSQVRLLPLRTTWIVCFVMLFIYLLSTRVLQGRHTLLLILLIIPAMGAYLEHWLTHARRSSSKSLSRRKVIAILAVIYLLLDGFVSFGAEKTYLKQSANWLKLNIPPTCNVVANNTKIAFFSENTILWQATELWSGTPNQPADAWLEGADIVVREYRKSWKNNALFAAPVLATDGTVIQPVLLQQFEGEKGSGVAVYFLDKHTACQVIPK